MLWFRSTTVATLVLACFLHPAILAQETEPGPRATGAGAYPLTSMHAAAWFGHQSDAGGKRLVLMVFFEGTPGWNQRTTDFKWETNQSPAKIQMSVGGIPIRVLYWSETSQIEVQDSQFDLTRGNVYLVNDVDSPTPQVVSLGTHDLSFQPDDNPAIILVRRNSGVRSALTGRTPKDVERAKAPEEVVAWDKEGLQLLLSGNPGDEQRACDLFRQAAARDYAASQYRLGYCYESGRGVDQDFSVANHWYERAANQGHVDAQYKLGHSYRVGRGVEIDLAVALRWYKMAAENGDGEALHNVGWMYATGQGVEANAEEAFSWFLRSAQRGERGSQYHVARCLHNGDGVARDPTSSYAWLLVLRAEGARFDPTIQEEVQELVQSLESELDEGAKRRAEELSQEWLRALAIVYLEGLPEP